MEHRKLSKEEIERLTARGCTAENWDDVEVAPAFDTDRCRNVRFSGKVKLGSFDKKVSLPGGMTVDTGIYDAAICNCTVP